MMDFGETYITVLASIIAMLFMIAVIIALAVVVAVLIIALIAVIKTGYKRIKKNTKRGWLYVTPMLLYTQIKGNKVDETNRR